jgi:adenylate cyclase
MQKEISEHNDDLPENRRMLFRIGINLGDVVEEGAKIYGDGVNIAARLESLAEAGGICISRTAYGQVKNKLNLGYEYLGEHSVKNISEPVHVYKVLMEADAAGKVIGEKRKEKRRMSIAAVIALLIGLGGLAGWYLYIKQTKRIEPASVEKMAFPLPDKPSIAVLPFENMTGEPAQEYFVDGITEGIITMLAKVPQLFVIARNSTFIYKGKAVSVGQVAEELSVRYVLEGSVQRSEERVRLHAQFIDALSGHHLWAERYDSETTDILAVQDHIAEKVVSALEVILTEGEQRRVRRAETSSPEAYDYYVRARQTYLRFTRPDVEQARQLWLKAFELDPNYAGALASVGWTHVIPVLMGWSKNPAQDLKQATEYADQSIAIDDTNPDAYALKGRLALSNHQFDEAVAYGEKAVALSPSHADNTALLASYLNAAGRYAEGLETIKRAIRLGPYYPNWYMLIIGDANRYQGNLEEAIAAYERRRDRIPDSPGPYISLASVYAEAGRQKAARSAAEKLLSRNPKFSVKQFAKFQARKDPKATERLLDGLRKAGLPE